jgi:predicted AAA+ superfamily ATPase
MVQRDLQKIARGLFKKYPVVSITGPRQSGKTTLIKYLYKDLPYVSLEDYDERQFAILDPRGFLNRFPDGAVFDEVQRTPEIFSYIQTAVDNRRKNGQYVLSGSQNFLLSESISQSLAGRVAVLKLLPFSLNELSNSNLFADDYEELIYTGFYPGIYSNKIPPDIFYSNYIQTYVERDVRNIKQIGDLNSFTRFMQLCAGRTGQLLNLSSLANDCGITVNTAKSWISILESSYTILLLQPHYRNFNKRVVKTPKLFFYDTGLAASLLKIDHPGQLSSHYLKGSLFENMIIIEILKFRYNQGLQSNLYFWRDSKGHEIDCIIEKANSIIPVEVKSGRTFNIDFLSEIKYWNSLSGNSAKDSFIIYGGEKNFTGSDATVLSWKNINEILRKI